MPRRSTAATLTTVVPGPTASSAAPLGAEQLAVQGDPADGKATVSARSAVATALANGAGFVGTVKTGAAVLVQMKDTSACVVASAWAIPVDVLAAVLSRAGHGVVTVADERMGGAPLYIPLYLDIY